MSLDEARARDASDPLRSFRDRFQIPGDDVVYLCGHSLGLQPSSARRYLEEELDAWAALGVEGHVRGRRPWLPYHAAMTDQLARLVGARPIEVVAMNTLTVNVHLLMVSFYRPTETRHRILIEKPAFPSDRYAVESQIRFHGLDPAVSLVEVEGGAALEAYLEDDGESVALAWISGVNYYSGEAFDLARLAELGHAKGAVVGLDLAHAAGNVPSGAPRLGRRLCGVVSLQILERRAGSGRGSVRS